MRKNGNEFSGLTGIYAVHVIKDGIDYTYVGSTKDLAERATSHLSKLRCQRHHVTLLQEQYNIGGEYKFEILELCEPDEQSHLEQEYIDLYMRYSDTVVCNKRKDATVPSNYKKINESDVRLIREMISKGIKNKEIAREMKCSERVVSSIRNGNRWKGVE